MSDSEGDMGKNKTPNDPVKEQIAQASTLLTAVSATVGVRADQPAPMNHRRKH
jgi:hypothetical protein